MNQRPRVDHSVAEADLTAREARTVHVAAAARGDSKLILKILLPILLGGGFFVLFAFLALTEHAPLIAVPNDALAVIAIPAYSPASNSLIKTVPALSSLELLAPHDTALVVLSNPLAVGVIAYVPQPEDLLALSTTGLSYTPIWNRLVVVGDQTFARRITQAKKLPWWIRLRAALITKNHHATLLVAPTPQSPWFLGSIDQKNDALEVLLQLHGASPETSRMVESTIQTTLFELVRVLLPVASSIRLPDNSIAQELKEDGDALSWGIQKNNGQTYTLFQKNRPVVSYESITSSKICTLNKLRLRETSPGDGKNEWGIAITTHDPLPQTVLEIFSQKMAILFCISRVDSL